MNKILELCGKYNVILLEDTCESMGSELNGKKLGSFGLMSSFSTYFGHHISTIEGGFVSTNDKELFEVLKSIRSHGWGRDNSPEYNKINQNKWNISDFNSLYTFYNSGFNLRSTDLQAFIGLGQINKLNEICKKRNRNFKIYQRELSDLKITPQSRGFVSNFAYPVIHPHKDTIVQRLKDENIEVRPMICGSMGSQPFYIKQYGRTKLPNSSKVNDCGFYLPNHPGLDEKDILKITKIVKSTEGEGDCYLQIR